MGPFNTAIYVERLTGGLHRLNRSPRYCAPHRARGLRSIDGATEWDEPESVVGRGMHRPKRGRVADIKIVPPAVAMELRLVDAERDRLRRLLALQDDRERELLAAAWEEGDEVKVADLTEQCFPKGEGGT